jgi:hypothetical protein
MGIGELMMVGFGLSNKNLWLGWGMLISHSTINHHPSSINAF